ncbi:DapH/DapD/GlmU-related protein [Sulfitobacter sp. 1A16787]|uniref:DapH/DapD/GlmU-related protein n=1 Tax=Sulfitobacter sp. 1A16787 TaxID=3368571 RepID=UPI00374662B8
MAAAVNLFKRYGLLGGLDLGIDLARTRLLYPKARLIRRPVYIRGHRHIKWGAGFTTGVGLRLDAFPEKDSIVLRIGKGVQVNDYVHIAAIQEVSIGDHTLIASKVFIADHHHGEYRFEDRASAPDIRPVDRPLCARPVHIGQRVWIGENVCILPGVSIGDGAVIGAGSVVTRDIQSNCIVAGNPAKVLRRYSFTTERWAQLNETSESV